jgi:hypothetical protein
LARYIYEWKPTQHGNRLFRRPTAATVKSTASAAAVAAAAETSDYSSLKKDELIEAAEGRKLDPSGTKADIIERLEADDEA